jgi:hypothetical protein
MIAPSADGCTRVSSTVTGSRQLDEAARPSNSVDVDWVCPAIRRCYPVVDSVIPIEQAKRARVLHQYDGRVRVPVSLPMCSGQPAKSLGRPLFLPRRDLVFLVVQVSVAGPTRWPNVLCQKPVEHVQGGAITPFGMAVRQEALQGLLEDNVAVRHMRQPRALRLSMCA